MFKNSRKNVPLPPVSGDIFTEAEKTRMEQAQQNILNLIQEATGESDVLSIDFRDIKSTTVDNIDLKRVRGSVRLMSGRVKTPTVVSKMRQAFLAVNLP